VSQTGSSLKKVMFRSDHASSLYCAADELALADSEGAALFRSVTK
jgi:hypothetical protein